MEKIIGDTEGSKLVMRVVGGNLEIISTFVPEALRGRGRGEKLMDEALGYAAKNKLEVVPKCSYAQWYMRVNKI